MKNYWSTFRDELAHWRISFPNMELSTDLEDLLSFTEQFLKAGETNKVYYLNATPHPDSFDRRDRGVAAYVDHLHNQTQHLDKFYFFWGNSYMTPGEKVMSSSYVSYYDEGGIVEAQVNDLGQLIKTTNDNNPNHLNDVAIRHVAPVTILGGVFPVNCHPEAMSKRKYPELSICLLSDIWFPWLIGHREEYDYIERGELYDNRELATCHTPRLNQFLSEVKILTKTFGGLWEHVNTVRKETPYSKMLHETGIEI